jgi:hypothetical protein
MKAYACTLLPLFLFLSGCGEMNDGSGLPGKVMGSTAGVYPRADCSDDEWEPNDGYVDATYLTLVDDETLTICGNHDYYLMDLKAGQTLKVSIGFYHEYGDLDLAIEATDGSWLASSQSTDDDESVSYTASEDIEVLVFVHGYAYAENRYRLSHRVIESAAGCPDDDYEPNDSRDQAATVAHQAFEEVVVCPGNDDWFAFDLGLGGLLSFSLINPDGKPEFEFFGPGETTPWPVEQSLNKWGDLTYYLQATVPGRYLARNWVHGQQVQYYLLADIKDPGQVREDLDPMCGDLFEGTRHLEGVGGRLYFIQVRECSYAWSDMYLHAQLTQPAGVDYHLMIRDYHYDILASPQDDWAAGRRVETATVSFDGGLGTNTKYYYLFIRYVGHEEGADLASPWSLELRGGSEGW